MHYSAFRYWGWYLLLFFILIGLWYLFCFKPYCEYKNQCLLVKEYQHKVSQAMKSLEECCECTEANQSVDYIDDLRANLGGATGEVVVTLVWETKDDLDLHLIEPSGEEIYYKHKRSRQGGTLDLDKNAEQTVLVTNPIENIYYASMPGAGKYRIEVVYYKKNTSVTSIPYTVALNINGKTELFQNILYREGQEHTLHEFIIR
jgi:uncharacterized protein YfaP (DUF2135 family)